MKKALALIAVITLVCAVIALCLGCSADTGKENDKGFAQSQNKGLAVKAGVKGLPAKMELKGFADNAKLLIKGF